WNAVERGLHAARARGFQRFARVVEPEVDARSKLAREIDVVVLEVDDLDRAFELVRGLEDVPDERLAAFVPRMRLTAVHDLQRTGRVDDRAQAIEVGENHVGTLVRRR